MFRILLCLMFLLSTGLQIQAQDSGKSLVSAARKRAADARNKKGEERKTILEDTLRILRMVPEKFPKATPSVARALVETGKVLRRLGRPEEAIVALNRVLEIPDENRQACEALHELTSLHRKARKYEEAGQALQKIIDGYPQQSRQRAQALIRLAGIRRRQKKTDEAEEALRRCIKEHGDLWRPVVDAVNALVALKIREKDLAAARRLLDSHSKAIDERFTGTAFEQKAKNALRRMKSRARLDKVSGATDGTP